MMVPVTGSPLPPVPAVPFGVGSEADGSGSTGGGPDPPFSAGGIADDMEGAPDIVVVAVSEDEFGSDVTGVPSPLPSDEHPAPRTKLRVEEYSSRR